jgi:hypothetical protein
MAQEETEEEKMEAEEAEGLLGGLLFHPLVPSKPEHQALFEI